LGLSPPVKVKPGLATPLPDSLGSEERVERLRRHAQHIRRSVVEMVGRARLGHIGGDFSVSDFFSVLRVDPTNPGAPQRDRFILSKGHCAAALYSTLALRGFFPVEELKTFVEPLSPLNGHPNRRKVPGVKANTGPLGHGLPIGVGIAILPGRPRRATVAMTDPASDRPSRPVSPKPALAMLCSISAPAGTRRHRGGDRRQVCDVVRSRHARPAPMQ
jgi:hypothetical protein